MALGELLVEDAEVADVLVNIYLHAKLLLLIQYRVASPKIEKWIDGWGIKIEGGVVIIIIDAIRVEIYHWSDPYRIGL